MVVPIIELRISKGKDLDATGLADAIRAIGPAVRRQYEPIMISIAAFDSPCFLDGDGDDEYSNCYFTLVGPEDGSDQWSVHDTTYSSYLRRAEHTGSLEDMLVLIAATMSN